MTFTYHGIGTRYVGEKNAVDFPGDCPWCKKPTRLRSYDTRLWFVLVYLPVIPLQKMRVLDQCPRCSRHRTIAHKKWLLIQDEARNKASSVVQEGRNDPASAIAAHRTLLGAHLMSDAQALADAMLSRFEDSAMVHLYLADLATVQNRPRDAQLRYTRAHELDPKDSVAREGLARFAVANGRLDLALDLLKPVIEARTARGPSACTALAGALVRAQRHAEAHAILTAMLEMFPTLRSDRAFNKQLRACEKKLAMQVSGRSISFGFVRPVVVGAVVVMLAVIGLVGADRMASAHQTLHVIDSVGGHLDVDIPGLGSVTFDAAGRQTLRASQGTYVAHVTGAISRDVQFTIGCSRWPCFLAHDVFVLDASGGSILCARTALYTPTGDSRAPAVRYVPLHDFQRFEKIDAAFESLPDEAPLEQNGYATREGIWLPEGPLEVVVFQMIDAGKARPAFDFAQARLKLQPDSSGMLYPYAQAAERMHMEKAAETFLEPRLEARPVDIDAHYVFVDLRSHTGGWKDAGDRYDDLMEREPDEIAWAMLRGMVSSSSSKRVELFRRVVRDDKYACNTWSSLARAEAANGDWKSCLDSARHAMECDYEAEESAELVHDALIALGRTDELEVELDQALTEWPCDQAALALRAELLAAHKSATETDDVLAPLLQRAAKTCPKQMAEMKQDLALVQATARRDYAAVVKLAKASKQADAKTWLIEALAEQGSLSELASWVETQEAYDLDPYTALGVALSCRVHGNVKQARLWERIGMQKLPAFGGGREAALLLSGHRVGVAEKALDLDLAPHDKAVVLALIACSDEAARTMLLEHASTLMPRPSFPCTSIELLASKPEKR